MHVNTGNEIGSFPDEFFDIDVVKIHGFLEDNWIGFENSEGAGVLVQKGFVILRNDFSRFRFGDFFDGKVRLADFATFGEKFVVSFDDYLQRGRKSVYGGGADAVKPA